MGITFHRIIKISTSLTILLPCVFAQNLHYFKKSKMPATQPSECTERFSQDPTTCKKLAPVMLLQGERFK